MRPDSGWTGNTFPVRDQAERQPEWERAYRLIRMLKSGVLSTLMAAKNKRM